MSTSYPQPVTRSAAISIARRLFGCCCVVLLVLLTTGLARTQEVAQQSEPRWEFFRGENFDGRSHQQIADTWNEKGPPVLWTIDLGQGYSGFVGRGDRIVTQYQTLAGQFVICLNAQTGETIWEHRYDWPYQPASLYPGPRSTPTISGDHVYYTTPGGDVGCLELDTGKPLWRVSTAERFDSPAVEFGFAASPVIYDDKLLIPAGGPDAAVVALDPATGETIWSMGDHKISYCSVYPIQFEGQNIVLAYFKNSICLFDLGTGAEIGNYRVSEDYDEHSAWPIYREPHLWVAGPFRAGCQLFQLQRQPDEKIQLRGVYKRQVMSNDVASCVLVGDDLFGFDIRDVQSKVHRPSRGQFSCIDFLTGDINWQNGSLGRRSRNRQSGEISSSVASSATDVGHASVIVAGDKLVMLSDTGTLIVADVDGAEYRELGRSEILGGEILWTAPTLIGGCVYARNHSRAVCVYLGQPADLEQVLPGEEKLVRYADEIEQPQFLNLAAIVLGTEPEYAMTSPQLSWLVNWFVVSLTLGWVVSPLIAVVLSKWIDAVSARLVFLGAALLFGVLGTTVAGRWLGVVYFSWPIVLGIVFECLVCQMQTAGEGSQVKSNPLLARLSLLFFIGMCLGYFWICKRLSLAFHWSFLMGFPAALPCLWIVKNSVQRREVFCVKQWLFSAASFTLFYWCGAGVIIWFYGT